MVALISLFAIVIISIVVVRIGTVALTMTGLSPDLAAFQAQSAFSGVGFTTSESEAAVSLPVRRNIIRILMLLGNAGLGSAIASLVLTFYAGDRTRVAMRLGMIAVGLAVVWLVSRRRFVDQLVTGAIERGLARWTRLEVKDYARLLDIAGGYTVAQIEVRAGDWLCSHTLRELRLNEEGILVLGVRRNDGAYIGSPQADAEIGEGDLLTCYGREQVMRELAERMRGAAGRASHRAAVERQRQIAQTEAENAREAPSTEADPSDVE